MKYRLPTHVADFCSETRKKQMALQLNNRENISRFLVWTVEQNALVMFANIFSDLVWFTSEKNNQVKNYGLRNSKIRSLRFISFKKIFQNEGERNITSRKWLYPLLQIKTTAVVFKKNLTISFIDPLQLIIIIVLMWVIKYVI